MKDGLVIGLLAAAGAGGALLLLSRRAEADQGTGAAPTYGGGGGVDASGGYGNYSFIDPQTGQPIEPSTAFPAGVPGAPGATGTPGVPGGSYLIQLSKPAEDAIVQNTQDTNAALQRDNEATNQAVRDAASQQANDQRTQRNVDIAVGAGLLAASYKGIIGFGKNLVSEAAGIGRNVPAIARAAITSPAAPVIGGALQGGLSIVQGVKDLQARNQGQGPYANLNRPAAVTAATANTAAAAAVGAGSLGLASFDFNTGVRFLGLPVATKGSRPGRTRLFGQSWLEI